MFMIVSTKQKALQPSLLFGRQREREREREREKPKPES
jgi:hypothetical protein